MYCSTAITADGTFRPAVASRVPPVPTKIVPLSTRCVFHDRPLPPATNTSSLPRSRMASGFSLKRNSLSFFSKPAVSRGGGVAAGIGVVFASRMSMSLILRTTNPSSIGTGRAGCMRRIRPASLPRYAAKSASESICTRTTSPVTLPDVPADQAFGYPIRGCTFGSTRCALNRTSDQPFPNGHRFPMNVCQSPFGELLHRKVRRLSHGR